MPPRFVADFAVVAGESRNLGEVTLRKRKLCVFGAIGATGQDGNVRRGCPAEASRSVFARSGGGMVSPPG
jgi:hypothetical protein